MGLTMRALEEERAKLRQADKERGVQRRTEEVTVAC
jgi:hypothetical protein